MELVETAQGILSQLKLWKKFILFGSLLYLYLFHLTIPYL